MHSIIGKTLLVAAFLPMILAAAVAPSPALSKYFISPKDEAAMPTIGMKWEVEKRQGNGYVVIVPASAAAELKKLAPAATLMVADITKELNDRLQWQRGWHNFDSVQTDLDKYAQQYPELVTVDKYGESQEGRPLRYMRILSKVFVRGNRPAIMISGATHGNELITVEVVFGLVDQLLKGYGNDARITKMIDSHELYFVPVINADGYVRHERYCNGIDPNRNYPYPENPSKKSNKAIEAIMKFVGDHQIKGSMDYHSAAAMIMYPWAWTYDPIPSPDREDFDKLTHSMAEANGYQAGPIASTIYIAPGSSADYYYWKYGTKGLGIEISQDGSPSLIPSMTRENTESTWRFIESF